MDADEKLLEQRRLAIEERKLGIEQEELALTRRIEEEKLLLAQRQYELEKQKTRWTKYSVLATALIAGVTIS